MKKTKRERFGSRLGFILVSAGCAVGLGNVWKFPYMCGKFGGAAFILIYMVFLLILGLPIMICEFSVGRGSQKSIAESFDVLEPKRTRWHKFKYAGIIGNYMLMMFYTTVGGWMLYYTYKSAVGGFSGINAEAISNVFDTLLASPNTMILWTFITIILSLGICMLGLKNGVERVTKIMMISLLSLMVVLVVRSLTLDGAMEGVKFYLIPNFEEINKIGFGNVVFGAMSQAFFTLSVGIGSMAIFGSYLDKERSITGEAISITLLDTFVAIMAGLIVIPACFAFNLEPGSGPKLIFITLPNIFSQMFGGRIWGTLFFLFLSFAALSTIVAVFENIISFAIDLWNWSRKKAVIVNILLMFVMSLPCVLGFNVLSDIHIIGEGTNIMDFEDFIISSNMLPLGSIVYLMFCTFKTGWGWENFIAEANAGKGMGFPTRIRPYLTYVLPIIVMIIYLKGYYDMFSSQKDLVLVIWMIIAVCCLAICFKLSMPIKRHSRRQEERNF